MMAGSGCTASRRLRVLLLYAIPRRVAPQDYVPGTRPDPFEQWQLLSEQGVDVEIMDPTPWPLNPFAGSHSLYQSVDPYRALKVLLARRKFDLVVVANDGGAILLAALRWLARFKVPIVIWDLCPTTNWRLRARIQDYVVPRVDGILAIHSSQAPYIAGRWGPRIPVSVTGYSTDTTFYHPSHNEPPEHILAIGDDPERDFPTLLAGMEGARDELVIKTTLAVPLDPYRHRSIRLIRERLDYPAFRSLYARSRFVVLPLTPHPANASGVTTLAEAFAMGKALIVTASDGISDFLLPDENCLVVPAFDAAALRAAIERLLREPKTCERLGRNARCFAAEQFSRPAFVRRFAETLRLHARCQTARQ
jgi:glycosyltransferase involved in cell wall biosynthesis